MNLKNYSKQAFCLLVLLLLVSCSKSDEPNGGKSSSDEKASIVSMNLEGETEDSRAMNFLLNADGPVLKMTEEAMKSVAVISNSAGTKKYYVEITWNKTAGQNHLYVKNLDINTDVYGTPLAMNTTENWYIAGYVGGTFDKNNKRVSFNPNGSKLQAVTVGKEILKPVPVYFPWTKLEVKEAGGRIYVNTPKTGKITFRTMGLLMRVELKNTMDYVVRIKSITYQSNALDTGAGYYDLNALPTVGTTALPAWTAAAQEPKYIFVDENGTTTLVPEMNGKSTYGKYFLVWGVPKAKMPASPVTHVLANAVRVLNGKEQNVPKMTTLYIWGSTNVPKHGTRRILHTSVVRPKLALEYFGEGYVGTNPQAANPVHITNTYDQGIGKYTHSQISAANFMNANWFVPEVLDAHGLFKYVWKYLKFENQATPGPHHDDADVRVNGQIIKGRDSYWNGNPSIYALRFQNADKLQYSAWRYTLGPTIDPAGYNAKGIRIESVYLGPHYKGSFEDTRKSSFWTLHTADYVSRFYPPVVAQDLSNGTSRYFYPMTWVKGSISPYSRICWGWGLEYTSAFNGTFMSPGAFIDETKLPNIVYWDIKTSVIPVQKAGTPWANN